MAQGAIVARLIISVDGRQFRRVELSQQRMTIGRNAEADIPLDDLAVSGEHARITTILDDSFLEDLDSTTGTSVNGAAVKKHVLCDGDVIGIGRYCLRYAVTEQPPDSNGGLHSNQVAFASAEDEGAPAHAVDVCEAATISVVLDGGRAGRCVALTKSVTTFGKAGMQVAAITRDDECYLLRHIEGEHPTAINGVHVAAEGRVLQEGDLIELAGVKLKFSRMAG